MNLKVWQGTQSCIKTMPDGMSLVKSTMILYLLSFVHPYVLFRLHCPPLNEYLSTALCRIARSNHSLSRVFESFAYALFIEFFLSTSPNKMSPILKHINVGLVTEGDLKKNEVSLRSAIIDVN